jgi:serine/threonine protein phosphatase 1
LKVQYLFENKKGRDFVCGDIHGCFDLLEKTLSKANFDYHLDRLFCVGDVIDRGIDSQAALFYLEQSWFYCIMGNHEQMMLDWCTETAPVFRNDAFRFHIHNGGSWVADYLRVHIQDLADNIYLDTPITKIYPALTQWVDIFHKLPFAIELKSSKKTIGIVHAEIPQQVKWPSLEAELNKTNVLYSVLFSRKYINSSKNNNYSIAGVDEIYCGHTIVKTPQKIGNVNYIDTGAFSHHNLTLIQLKYS